MRKYLILFLLIPFLSFGQISETNVTMTAINTALDESTFNLGLLCVSDSVNKWSIKKPVVQHNASEATWWLSVAGDYSLTLDDLPIASLTSSGTWALKQPTDVTGYKQGDFRGYLSTSTPVVYFEYTTETPTEGEEISSLKTNVEFFYDRNEGTSEGVTVTNLGYEDWYYGVRLTWNDGSARTYYQTVSNTISNVTRQQLILDLTDTEFSTLVANSTTFTWYAFLSDKVIGTYATNTWVNSAPALTQAILLPAYSPVHASSETPNTGTFDVELTDLLNLTYPANIHTYVWNDNSSKDIAIQSRPTAGTWTVTSTTKVSGIPLVGDMFTVLPFKASSTILRFTMAQNDDAQDWVIDVKMDHTDPLVPQLNFRITKSQQ